MDEIDYKLRSQNPTLISHAISKLIEIIRKKLEVEKDILKISEFKLLSSKCNSDDSIVSTSACQALVVLGETGLWDVKSALATFMGCLSSSKNYQAITVAVSQLLILNWKSRDKCNEYTLQVPTQHPFITILTQDKRSWRSILNQMKFILHHHDRRVMEQSVQLLRPVFVHILCDPSMDSCESCKREAWQLVIKSNDTTNLRKEILLWLCTNRADTCIDANYRILELADLMLLKRDKEFCTALVPLIASLTIQLLEYGHEPVQNFYTILDLFEYCYSYIGNITIALMAEIILICPAAYLLNAFQICTFIVDKMPCHVTLLNALAAALLKWLAYPSLLCSDASMMAKKLLIEIMSRKKMNSGNDTVSNEMLLVFNCSDRYIQFYTELLHSLYSLENETPSWLENLSLAPIDLRYMCKLVLCGIFLHSDEPPVVRKVCRILVQITREINSFASHMMSLLLHKLTKTRDSSTLKYLLLTVPEFAVTKDNLPIVIHTLDTLLNNGKPLKYFAIQLYTKALKSEPRCYRFVSTALMDTMEKDRSWHSDVVCARAINYICESWPEHGEELVPLLSQILNRCIDQNGGAASALALDSLSALCKSAVIGVHSMWQVLAPKMRKEKRTVVLESLCELFANVPSYPYRSGEDYDSFIVEVVTLLWSYTICYDTRVARAAFKALKSYHVERIPLSALPLDFRADINKTSNEDTRSEDSLQYVPGTCWIQMLKNVNGSILTAAGDLLIFYISNELEGFKKRIYYWPQGEPQNFKYLPERSVIRAVGEYLRRGDSSNRIVTMECLRVFAHKYKKAIPNVKWDFLKETMQISEEAREYGLSIASRHCKISQSAKLLMESFLSKYTCRSEAGRLLLNEKHLVFYSNLEELCEAIPPNKLKGFLETSLYYAIDRILLNDEKSVHLFNHIMSSYVTALKNNSIQIGNRTLLTLILEEITEKVNLTSKHFEKYFAAVMELLAKDVERMTSPSTWWVETPEKLKTAIAIRVQTAFKGDIGPQFAWLKELVDATESNPELQTYLLKSIQKVQNELRFEKFCNFEIQKDWILDFIGHIDALMVEAPDEKNRITYYCDILFILVICLSGVECLLPKKESLVTSRDIRIRLFPQAISMLIDRQVWKSIARQIMKWLNHMRNSSVPDVYIFAFQNALILLRQEEDYNSEWRNYLSIKTRVDKYN
ncbi:focadhesin [Solenopsis invicta]|uniref:focadhesin n=1 Tax=Solenopsis invicta TaxID=13686 RepID=UPI000595C468|nr:focadhesin [Solenopsis invicta]XP_025987762.1 focadhesin [Solenopsis invicta]XP_025987763.1 focadhesin [Solenopsis invicta]XP_039314178.1 focadhesin [Solenopsis invicta]XP_039314179.1 focadhesin [Solenopsis invicta]